VCVCVCDPGQGFLDLEGELTPILVSLVVKVVRPLLSVHGGDR
jgi:hypothetical protein